ncbi:MAG: protein kinase, partial [Gemmatimonadales bacterium]
MSASLDRLKTALSGRYDIERELGAGGMATVYLAHDPRHERRVALKVLRPELAATLGPERFLREIRIAANLTHPHILPVHDSGEADGFLYYVMPYIEGESLREKLQREGELPVDEAVRILREVADALAHAHGHGVVHRDIKPDNVLISGRHAMVMDFGVAKAVSEATGREKLTTAGVALGTPSYMAPEQAAADPTTDHRADIYALGAMAYELLAGRPPFTGTTSQMVLAAHMTEAPAPVTQHRPAVPAALGAVVMKCLEKKPADRWQTAEELLPQLEAMGTPSAGVTPTTMQPMVVTRGVSRKPLAIGGAVALAAAIGVAALVLPGRGPDLVENRVFIAVFANETGDASLDHIGKIAADLLARGLQEIRLVEVVDPRGALTSATDEADAPARSLAEQVGAAVLVSGEYYRFGDSLTFQAQITETGSGRLIQSLDPVSAAVDDPMDGMHRLNQRVMASIVVQFDPELAGMADVIRLPASYDAYREFISGVELFAQADFAEAARHFHQAVATDPGFVAASMYLAILYLNMNQPAAADSIVRSLGESRERLTELERHTLDWLRANVRGDNVASYRAILQAYEIAPAGPETGWAAGQAAASLNRPQEALTYFSGLDPEHGVYSQLPMLWFDITQAHHMLGEHEAELEAARLGREQFPDVLDALGYEIRALAAMGRLDELTPLLDEAFTLPEAGGNTPALLMRQSGALELMAHGHGDAAQQLFDRAIAWYQQRTDRFAGSLAQTLYWAGRWEEARAAFQVLARRSPNNLGLRINLGILAARLGDRD